MSEMEVEAHSARGHTGYRAVTEHLDRLGLPYTVVEHEPTVSAVAEAAAADMQAQDTLKTLVLRDGRRRWLLVALPASERVDMGKVRALLGDHRIQFADEKEIARAFPRYDVGAAPPLGPGVPHLELVDKRVVGRSRMLCGAGDHGHSLLVSPGDLIRVAAPMIADICQD
jgi:prolyl-tRNA editing enzyme YbaK/EbsC (Cys-tRNA(Pro) deacylase)